MSPRAAQGSNRPIPPVGAASADLHVVKATVFVEASDGQMWSEEFIGDDESWATMAVDYEFVERETRQTIEEHPTGRLDLTLTLTKVRKAVNVAQICHLILPGGVIACGARYEISTNDRRAVNCRACLDRGVRS